MFPNNYDGALFFADYSRNYIKYLALSSDGSTANGNPITFDTNTNGCISMTQAPDGSLWLSSIYGIERIYCPVSGNKPPTITKAKASKQAGPAPLVVNFKGAGTDPENKALTYLWQFGDGTTSTQQNPKKTYTKIGTYNAILKISDGKLEATSNAIKIEVGEKPLVTIVKPVASSTFAAGKKIVLSGQATYKSVNVTDANSFTWNVLLFHDDHTHPVLNNAKGPSTFITAPTTGHAFEGNCYLIISLSVIQDGLETIQTIKAFPREINGTVTSSPQGIPIVVDGLTKSTPFTTDQLIGFSQVYSAPATTCVAGTKYTFSSWSDGGAASHTVVTPKTDNTLTVKYTASGSCNTGPSCATYNACNKYVPGTRTFYFFFPFFFFFFFGRNKNAAVAQSFVSNSFCPHNPR